MRDTLLAANGGDVKRQIAWRGDKNALSYYMKSIKEKLEIKYDGIYRPVATIERMPLGRETK